MILCVTLQFSGKALTVDPGVRQAEAFVEEGSFQKALEIYQKLRADPKQSVLPERELKVRIADCQWRARATTTTDDPTMMQKAEQALRGIAGEEIHDVTWAAANESLGDYFWTRKDLKDWGSAYPFYQSALDFWAASSELPLASKRFLTIVQHVIPPPNQYYNQIPIGWLDQALQISRDKNEQAQFHFAAAETLMRQGGDVRLQRRVGKEFEAAIELGKGTDWYDDALFQYGQYLESYGEYHVLENGSAEWKPDFVRALELYKELATSFVKGKSRYVDQARRRMEDITRPQAQIQAPSVFLPDSDLFVNLSWRNEKKLHVSIYEFDVLQRFPGTMEATREEEVMDLTKWLNDYATRRGRSGLKLVKELAFEPEESRPHQPGQKAFALPKLTPGSYLVTVDGEAGSKPSVDLLMVSSSTLTIIPAKASALFYAADALTGKPAANAQISILSTFWNDGKWRQEFLTGTTDATGLWKPKLKTPDPRNSNHQIWAVVKAGAHAAVAQANTGSYFRDVHYQIDVSTDRPAYRPGDKVEFHAFIRNHNGSIYSTPQGSWVQCEVYDSLGKSVLKKEMEIDGFGSIHGDLTLDGKAALGMYRIDFRKWDPEAKSSREHWGSAQVFRLEEYKLPEFKVNVSTQGKTFLAGDKVSVDIHAETYFGSPVGSAQVEVLVRQKPYMMSYSRPCEFAWYYPQRQNPYQSYPGTILKRDVLKTDATGSAHLDFETTANGYQDFEYEIEARVTDSSRREIVGTQSVRVTRQSYYVFFDVPHQIYQPGSKASVDLKAKNANEEPVEASGRVVVKRQFWVEGDASASQGMNRTQSGVFPWRRMAQPRMETEQVLAQDFRIQKDRNSSFEFTPAKDGVYTLEWSSRDKDGVPIQTSTSVIVCSREGRDLAYAWGGLQIILDKDTYHRGEKAQAVIVTPQQDSWVLLTTKALDLYSYQVIHLDGTAKFVEIPVGDEHEPNFFIQALSMREGQMLIDSKEVIVPPVEKFLNVRVTPDKPVYEPREKGLLDVFVTDYQEKPVAARVVLSLVDASVFYIQSELTSDIRELFYGEKRGDGCPIQSSLQFRPYRKWVQDKSGLFQDEEELVAKNERRDRGAVGYDKRQEMDAAGGRFFALGKVNAVSEVSNVYPASAAAPAMKRSLSDSLAESKEKTRGGKDAPGESGLAQITVRSDFRNTILWNPSLQTDEKGHAQVDFVYPDSLTSWKASARVATTGAVFGNTSAETKTSKALVCRLQAPRFFTEKDASLLSAVVNNNSDKVLSVKVTFQVEGLQVEGLLEQTVSVKAGSEARVDLPVSARATGMAKVKVFAQAPGLSDAMERSYPVHAHGMERFLAYAGTLAAGSGDASVFSMKLPKERVAAMTELKVMLSPSIATTCLDALPYLIQYPYGCVEQTTSRFLPAAIVARLLERMNLDPDEIEGRMFGGIDKATASATHQHEKGKFSKLDEVMNEGLDRLADMQHSDGGWGWWKKGESDHYMTAYVVQALGIGREAGLPIPGGMFDRAVDFLRLEIVEEETSSDMLAWMLYAASYSNSFKHEMFQKQVENLWKQRSSLNPFTLSLFALAIEKVDHTRALALIRNLENGVQRDNGAEMTAVTADRHTTPTAHWGRGGIVYRWSDGAVEGTAFALRALLAVDPQNALVEPVMTWLVKNRRGAQWSDTRDTAIVVLALTDYMRVTKETTSNVAWKVLVNGKEIRAREISGGKLLEPSVVLVPSEVLKDGDNEIRIVRTKGGKLYYSAFLSYYSLEDPIPAAGNEVFVRREYFHYVGRPTLLKGLVYDRVPMKDGDTVQSGERIEVKLTIETKNDLEYMLFEDFKPAGCEAVQIQSGGEFFIEKVKSEKLRVEGKEELSGDRAWVHSEWRDRHAAFFISKLKQGIHVMHYDLRAEAPGTYHALPTKAQAMYVPEIRANSDETRMKVEDRKQD